MTDDFEEITTTLKRHISDYVQRFDLYDDPTGIASAAAYVEVVNIGLKGLHDAEVSDTALKGAINSCTRTMMESLAFLSLVMSMATLAAHKDKGVDE